MISGTIRRGPYDAGMSQSSANAWTPLATLTVVRYIPIHGTAPLPPGRPVRPPGMRPGAVRRGAGAPARVAGGHDSVPAQCRHRPSPGRRPGQGPAQPHRPPRSPRRLGRAPGPPGHHLPGLWAAGAGRIAGSRHSARLAPPRRPRRLDHARIAQPRHAPGRPIPRPAAPAPSRTPASRADTVVISAPRADSTRTAKLLRNQNKIHSSWNAASRVLRTAGTTTSSSITADITRKVRLNPLVTNTDASPRASSMARRR